MAVKQIALKFATNTTLHGIPIAARQQSILQRIFWIMVTIICTVLFLAQMIDLVQLFQKYNTIVQVKLENKALPFPAVTVCNLNPFRMSKLQEVPELAALLAAFDTAAEEQRSNTNRRNNITQLDRDTGLARNASAPLQRVKRQTCPQPYEQVGSMCYIGSEDLSENVASRDGAQTICEAYNGTLAVFINENEMLTARSWAKDKNYNDKLWSALKYFPGTNKVRWHLGSEMLLVGYSGKSKLNIDGGKRCYYWEKREKMSERLCTLDHHFLCQTGYHEECPLGSTPVNNYCYSIMAHGIDKGNYATVNQQCTVAGGRLPVLRNSIENQFFGNFLNDAGISDEVYLSLTMNGANKHWIVDGVTEPTSIYFDVSSNSGNEMCYTNPPSSLTWQSCDSKNKPVVCQFARVGYTTTVGPTTTTVPTTTVTTTTLPTTTVTVPVDTTDHCIQLSPITRGTGPIYSMSDRPVGTAAQFSCDGGLTLFGHTTITCLPGGVWSAPPAACKAQCDAITLDASLRISVTYSDPSKLQSSIATFTCDDNNVTTPHILMPTTTTCLENGEWNQPFPTQCLAVSQATQQAMQSAVAQFAEVANDAMALQQTVTDTVAYFTADLSQEQVTRLGYQLTDLVVNCRYAGGRCQDEAGANEGLLLELYVNQSDYMTTSERAGIMLAVHDQQETVVADTMGFTVPMGFVTSFGVMLTKIERLGAPYGDCVNDADDNKEFYFKTKYSLEGCYRSCYQKNLIAKCNCGDPRLPLPKGGKYCSVNERSCIQSFVADKTALDKLLESCDCPPPCSTLIYSTIQTNLKWPTLAAMPLSCRTGSEQDRLECHRLFRKNYGRAEVYFVQINSRRLFETPAFTVSQLLSAAGGNMGLWIGPSVLTFAEIGYFITALITYLTCKKLV